ncbi:MAG TPA: hypothetical protein DCG19_12110 [Cryomorphaceae bacterium]|nr:hypothetical protein [Owenweeksia sp.]HAD98144.1 hypothetical protein [Cryomorphaceae bacterium]
MLFKSLAALCLGCMALNTAFAQLTFHEDDRISHHIGLQVNPLLKQIVNLGNSPAIDNPFLLKYGIRFNRSRTEILMGLGYQYSLISSRNDLKSDLSDLSFRAGYAKKHLLGSRFELGLGMDLVLNARNNQTVNVQAFNSGVLDSTVTTTKSIANRYGAGPQLTLDYYITNRIKIGTEATFYFLTGIEKFNVTTENYREDFSTGELIENSSYEESEDKITDFKLQVPVALFLTIIL